MVIKAFEVKRLNLAISIIREIIIEQGGEAQWPEIYAKWIPYTTRFPDVELRDVFKEALKHFLVNERTGYYSLHPTLKEFKSSEEIAREIKELMKEMKVPSPKKWLIPMAKFGRTIKGRMRLPHEYLASWENTPQDVIMELKNVTKDFDRFLRKYGDDAPSAFEYLIAKAFSVLFQLPLYIEYGTPITLREENCIVWRGDIENYKPIKCAPGGKVGSDMAIYARGPYYVLAEATLRYTPRQWKEEIEPIFRHAENFIAQNKLSEDNVYLVFTVAKKVLSDTYKWLRSKAESEEYKILALRAEDLVEIPKASLFALGLTHAEIRVLFDGLDRRLRRSYGVKEYLKDLEEAKNKWCRDLLEPNLEVFIAIKAYEILLKRGGLSNVTEIVNEITKSEEIKDYVDLIHKTQECIKKRRKAWIHQLSLLGLAREVNNILKALPAEEFENKILKTYSYILRTTSLKEKVIE